MAGITGPTKTGYKWNAAKAKFMSKGKSASTAGKMAGLTTIHEKVKSTKRKKTKRYYPTVV